MPSFYSKVSSSALKILFFKDNFSEDFDKFLTKPQINTKKQRIALATTAFGFILFPVGAASPVVYTVCKYFENCLMLLWFTTTQNICSEATDLLPLKLFYFLTLFQNDRESLH